MNFHIRPVEEQDAALLRTMAQACPPLDVHTPYTYWVIARFFGHLSFLLLLEDRPVGYITALDIPEGVFVWQIGILPEYRGRALSRKLIGAVAEQAAGKPVWVTIDPANTGSRSAFEAYCRAQGLFMQPAGALALQAKDLPDFLEREIVYRIS